PSLEGKFAPRAWSPPQPPSLPPRAFVVDPAVDVLRKEPRRIRQPQHHEIAVDERQDRVRAVAHRDRNVFPQSQNSKEVDPDVITRLRAARVLHVAELRSGKLVQRPALGAVLAG